MRKKLGIISLALVMTLLLITSNLSTATVNAATGETVPNDTMETATDYDSRPMVNTMYYSKEASYTTGFKAARLETKDDVDWYRVFISENQGVFCLRNIASKGYEMEIYKSNGEQLWKSAGKDIKSGGEIYLNYSVTPRANYYVKVYCRDDGRWDTGQYNFYFGTGHIDNSISFANVALGTMTLNTKYANGYGMINRTVNTFPHGSTLGTLCISNTTNRGVRPITKQVTINGTQGDSVRTTEVIQRMNGVFANGSWKINGKLDKYESLTWMPRASGTFASYTIEKYNN